ncbi:MAG: hypothetical protein M3P51_02990 [Chloroflexota bacterium]|nr:hypothetical protein [Chloroflexota bacterium]
MRDSDMVVSFLYSLAHDEEHGGGEEERCALKCPYVGVSSSLTAGKWALGWNAS